MPAPRARWQRAATWLTLIAGLLAVTACRADLVVEVRVEPSGSGVVEATLLLDEEAADVLIDLEGEEGLRLDDLSRAGWQLTPPTVADDNSVRTVASKEFGSAEQFGDVMDELAGPEGLFAGFDLVRDESFAQVDYTLTGRIEPTGVAGLSDPALDAALGGSLAELAAAEGVSADVVGIELVTDLPGTVREESTTGATQVRGEETVRVWRTNLAGAPIDVVDASSTREVAALVWRGVAVLAGVLAAVVLLGNGLRILRPERRRARTASGRKPLTRDVNGPRTENNRGGSPGPAGDAVEASGAAVEPADRAIGLGSVVSLTHRAIALDGMGVIYRQGDDINQLLVPFVRSKGSVATRDEIVARARQLSLGRITPAEFWVAVGVAGDPNALDEEYLSQFQLSPGVVKFLRSLRDKDVRVACITNDCTAWANRLRARHSLDGLIDVWVVSGAVGVRKPDRPIFEVLRRVLREAPGDILVVDDDVVNLDAARALGFDTLWFAPDGASQVDGQRRPEHEVIRRFPAPDGESVAN